MIRLDTQRILVVDDEMDNLKIFQATMEMLYNATVQTASGADQALAILENFQPTLIVTDLSMPRIDGYGLLARLRDKAETASVPVIALTAHAMAGDRERILAAGFNGYMSKPFDVTQLGPDLLAFLDSFEKQKVTSAPVDHVPAAPQPPQAALPVNDPIVGESMDTSVPQDTAE